jgi:hypothetical protein
VQTVKIDDSLLYVTGFFTTINTTQRQYGAALNINSAAITAWSPRPVFDVYDMAFYNNDVYLGGSFNSIQNQTIYNAAKVDKTYGALSNWMPNPGSTVLKLLISNNFLCLAGLFQNTSGHQRNGLAVYNLPALKLNPFNPNLTDVNYQSSTIRTMALYGNTLYISPYGLGGINLNNEHRGLLAGLDIRSQKFSKFDPKPDDAVLTLDISKTKLITGGAWASLDKNLSHSYFAVYTLPPLTAASSIAFDNIQSNSVHVTWTNGNGEGRLVVVKDGNYGPTPGNGKQYMASSIYKQGDKIEDSYVVYNGTSNNVTVTDLLPDHTYYFTVYEFNGYGSSVDYLSNSFLTANVTTTPVSTFSNENAQSGKAMSAIIFPNPTRNNAILKINGELKNVNIHITDASGKILWKKENIFSNRIELPVKKLSSGIYFVNVDDGTQSIKIKLVKAY